MAHPFATYLVNIYIFHQVWICESGTNGKLVG